MLRFLPSHTGSLVLIFALSACSSVPWDSVRGLKEGKSYQKLPPQEVKAVPQVFSATEGEALTISQSEARHETAIGNVILMIRGPNCGSCDQLEETMRSLQPKLRSDLRLIRIEAQSAADVAAFQTDIIPTMILLSGGTERKRLLGLRKEKEILKFIESEFVP